MKKHVKKVLLLITSLGIVIGIAVLLMTEQGSRLTGPADGVNPVMAAVAALLAALAGILVFAVRSWKTERNAGIS